MIIIPPVLCRPAATLYASLALVAAPTFTTCIDDSQFDFKAQLDQTVLDPAGPVVQTGSAGP